MPLNFSLAAGFALAANLLLHLPVSAATYHVRPDGGNAVECTGLADAPYPGQGSNQPCAWSHPYWAVTGGPEPVWRIAGGDTLLIGQGSYRMGFGAPNTGWCSEGYPWDCHLPPLPPGPDAEHHTRLAGEKWNGGCQEMPEFWGAESVHHILGLEGSSHVHIACLEITDHSSCVEFHAAGDVCCNHSAYPYGDWASIGLYAADSEDVLLQDLDIHGLANAGVLAGRLAGWTIHRTRIAGNGWAGWKGDLSPEPSGHNGTMIFQDFTVEWNGCAESWPGLEPTGCWDHDAGGYGDGLGLAATGGSWIFEDAVFRWNTSDGLDLLYLSRNGEQSQAVLRRVRSYGNAGDQVKVTGAMFMENSLLVSQCGFFDGKSFAPDIDGADPITHCRSGGSALALGLMPGQSSEVVNTTLAGQGDCLVILECALDECDGSESASFVNNIFQGYTQYGADDQTCWMWSDGAGEQAFSDYNIIHNLKENGYPAKGSHDLALDPGFRDPRLETFNGMLRPHSAGIDSGLGSASPADDLLGKRRPLGKAPDRGAFEHPPLAGAFCPLLLDP